MSWSYSSPLAGGHHVLRYLLGDVLSARQLMQDEELLYALTQQPNARLAAADVADILAMQLALRPDIRTQDTSVTWSATAQHFAALAIRLRTQNSLGLGMPYAGGLSQAEKDTAHGERDLVQPSFTRERTSWIDEELV